MKKKLTGCTSFAAALLLAAILSDCGSAETPSDTGNDVAPPSPQVPAESTAPDVSEDGPDKEPPQETASPEDSAGENDTPEPDTPAAEPNDDEDADTDTDQSIPADASWYTPAMRWYLAHMCRNDQERAEKEASWANFTPEGRVTLTKWYESKYGRLVAGKAGNM